jgi:phthiodiolone/phenolphthiodiolone dimycocerosates ketoreductase
LALERPAVRAFCETQEPISYDGEFCTLRDAVVELPPLDGVPPTLWLAGGGPKVLEAIGRGADGWLYTRGGTLGRPEVIADRLRTLLRARFPELAQLAG